MKRNAPHTLRLEARLDRLEQLVNFVIARAREIRLPEKAVDDLHLAVDEACTNIIRYAYPPGQEGEIELSCHPGPDAFGVSIRDWGKPFDPLAVPPPDLSLGLDERPVGGLGILFIRKAADGLSYRREAGTNLLSISKKI